MIETTDILNEIEKDKLLIFKEDRAMFDAVKKYLLSYLYAQGVTIPGKPANSNRNWALMMAWERASDISNEQLGADLRAVTRGIQVIESGFKEIEELIRTPKVEEESENPAV